MKRVLAVIFALVAQPAWSEPELRLPDGVTLLETRWDEEVGEDGIAGLWARFRFVAPALAAMDYAQAEPALDALCRDVALAKVAADGRTPRVVIVSVADRPAEFGAPDAEIVQYFAAYDVTGGRCAAIEP